MMFSECLCLFHSFSLSPYGQRHKSCSLGHRYMAVGQNSGTAVKITPAFKIDWEGLLIPKAVDSSVLTHLGSCENTLLQEPSQFGGAVPDELPEGRGPRQGPLKVLDLDCFQKGTSSSGCGASRPPAVSDKGAGKHFCELNYSESVLEVTNQHCRASLSILGILTNQSMLQNRSKAERRLEGSR